MIGQQRQAPHPRSSVFIHQGELGLTQGQTGKLREIHQARKKDQIRSEADPGTRTDGGWIKQEVDLVLLEGTGEFQSNCG